MITDSCFLSSRLAWLSAHSAFGNVTAAHVIATIPNFNILEFSYGEVPWRAELIDPPEQVTTGALTLSERPGLGIKLNEKTAAKYAVS
jgi:galactonate dehydratase